MNTRSDPEWIRLLKQDDRQALDDLWLMLYTDAAYLASRYRSHMDVTYQAALLAYQRITTRGIYQFRFACPFAGYCRRILINEALRLLRKHELSAGELPDDLPGDKDVVLTGRVMPSALRACLDALPKREQTIIALLYFHELDSEVVSMRMGLTRTHTNVIAFRARRKLRTCLEQHGFHHVADIL